MTVHFIGAGPGAPDLLTLRAARLIAEAGVVLHAGALVPPEVLDHAHPDATRIDTQDLTLDEIVDHLQSAHADGHDVARLQSGDLSLFSAVAEQARRLDALGIPYDLTPGVPAYAAAAAALKHELTKPHVSQALTLARHGANATTIPQGDRLVDLANGQTTLVVHLGVHAIEQVVAQLTPAYGPDCPVAVVARASRPDELVLRGTLATIAEAVEHHGIRRTAVILVGRTLAPEACATDSHLYDAARRRSR